MKNASTILIALITGLSVPMGSPQAWAQYAQRDAAITRCIAQAHRQYARPGRNGTAVYKSCMFSAGFSP
jgi:hypothetical protein